jgi:hypothetical protein
MARFYVEVFLTVNMKERTQTFSFLEIERERESKRETELELSGRHIFAANF